MRPHTEHIEQVRLWALGATGCACFIYAALAIWQNRPDPLHWWLPAGMGAVAALVIFIVALIAEKTSAEAALDELYTATARKSGAQAYWWSVLLFFALLAAIRYAGLSHETAMAIFGVLMGGAFPALFVFHSLRQD